jgi:hypothetical protein
MSGVRAVVSGDRIRTRPLSHSTDRPRGTFVTRRLPGLVLGLAVALPLAGLPLAPASAATSASVTVTPPTDSALYDGCYEYPYTYAVAPATADWDLAVTLTDPRGAIEASDLVAAPEPISGTGSFLLCGGVDDYGTYTITAQLTSYDAAHAPTAAAPVAAPFTLGKPASRTVLRASTKRPRYDGAVTFRVVSSEQGRTGYSRTGSAKVRLVAHVRGAWRVVNRGTASASGVTVFRYRWDLRRAVRLRAVTLGSSTWRASVSKPVRVQAR